MKDKWQELADHYRYQAEAYEIFYQNRTKHDMALIVFAGIITSMTSDVVKYEQKNGKARTIAQNERIEVLQAIYDDLSDVASRNDRMRLLLADNNKRLNELEVENEKYKSELEAIKLAFEAE